MLKLSPLPPCHIEAPGDSRQVITSISPFGTPMKVLTADQVAEYAAAEVKRAQAHYAAICDEVAKNYGLHGEAARAAAAAIRKG